MYATIAANGSPSSTIHVPPYSLSPPYDISPPPEKFSVSAYVLKPSRSQLQPQTFSATPGQLLVVQYP
jgi:hypothetical protein